MTTHHDELYTVTKSQDTVIITFTCEIDFNNATALNRYLTHTADENPDQKIIADFVNVDYIDSSGIATLLQAVAHFQSRQINLILCNLKDQVRSIFQIARLDSIFNISDTQETALSL